MKKVLGFVALCIVVTIIIYVCSLKPRYKVMTQLRSSSPDYIETFITAIVYHVWTERKLDELAEEIIREHRRINYDVPTDKIVLQLYRGDWNYKRSKDWKSVTIKIE